MPARGRSRGLLRLHLLANHWPALHGLRVIGILSVLQWHVTAVLAEANVMGPGAGATLSLNTFFGMDLFFVISGFLIGTMMLHALDAAKKESLGRFYLRRAFRIFPLYYVVLTLLLVFEATPDARGHVIREYLYLTNYGSLVPRQRVVMSWGWSLCVEEHFYLLAPLLVAALVLVRSHRARLAVLAALWIVPLVVRLVVLYRPQLHAGETYLAAVYVRTHTRFDTLIAGVFAAYLNFHHRDRLAALLALRGRTFRAVGTAAAGCLIFLLLARPMTDPPSAATALCWGTVTSVLHVALILLLLYGRTAAGGFLGHRAFLPVATLGYGIYLVHVPVLDQVLVPLAIKAAGAGVQVGLIWLACFVLLTVVSTGIAYALHLLVEKPALYLRDRIAG